jgi:hypothetical protein
MCYRWSQGGNRRHRDCGERAWMRRELRRALRLRPPGHERPLTVVLCPCLRRLDANQVRRPQSWAQDRWLTEGREYVLAVGHGELKIVVACR